MNEDLGLLFIFYFLIGDHTCFLIRNIRNCSEIIKDFRMYLLKKKKKLSIEKKYY